MQGMLPKLETACMQNYSIKQLLELDKIEMDTPCEN